MPRSPSTDLNIDSVIWDMPPDLAKIAVALRKAIRSAAPALEECVKWNAPNWRGRKLVLCLMVYPNHINLGLWRGAELAPSFPSIEGTGKSLRHVRIRDERQARSAEIRKLILAAAKLDER